MSSSWLSVKEGPHPTNNRFYLCEFRNVFFNHHRVLICYSVLRVAKCWITGAVVSIEFRIKINEVRRIIPSFKLLKDSKVYDILIRKSSTIQLFCDCYQLQSLQRNTVFSRQKGVYTQWTFCVQKREIFEPHRLEILKLWLHAQVVWAPFGLCRLACVAGAWK